MFIFSNFLDIKFLQNYGPKVSAMKTKKKPSKNTTFYFCGKKKRKNNYSEQVISLCKKE